MKKHYSSRKSWKKATEEFNFVPTPMFPFQGLYLNVGKRNSEKSIMYYHVPSKTTPKIFPFTLEKVTQYFFPPYTRSRLTPQNQVKTTQKLPKTWFQFQVPKLNLNQHNNNLNILSKHTEKIGTAAKTEL